MAMRVAGKKVLVFGGTSGIGLSTTVELARLGARVVAISRDPSRADALLAEWRQQGTVSSMEHVSFQACDVLNRTALQELFTQQAPFDMLVSTATGGERALGPFLQMDLDGYQASFSKLWGYANVVRLGAEHLSKDGSIVLVSGAPARRARPGQAALASVGGAVEQFARAIAPELAPRRINVVSPGIIETPMFGPDCTERQKRLSEMTSKQLIPRAGSGQEVANAIIFLLQNEFVTGTTVDVDGGWLQAP